MKTITQIKKLLVGAIIACVAASINATGQSDASAGSSPANSQTGTSVPFSLSQPTALSPAEQGALTNNWRAARQSFTNDFKNLPGELPAKHFDHTNGRVLLRPVVAGNWTNRWRTPGNGPRIHFASRAAARAQIQAARERMISEQLVARGISNHAVLDAMRKVPRLLPYEQATNAFEDKPVSIRYGRTVESPYVVASVAEQFNPNPTSYDRVLELGTGSGYQTAVLSLLVKEVYSVEANALLARRAQVDLENLGYTNNVFLRTGAVTQGWPEAAPFDAVVVNGSSDQVSDAVISQLKDGGRLIIQVDRDGKMQVLEKTGGQMVPLTSRAVHLPQTASNPLALPQLQVIGPAKAQ